MKCIKTIRSYAGHAQWIAEASEEPIAWLARFQTDPIPSPYAYSPVVAVWEWNGKVVICRETAHRKYQVFEVPADMPLFADEQDAEDAHIAHEFPNNPTSRAGAYLGRYGNLKGFIP